MGKPSDHGVTWSPFAAAAPAPLVGLDHLAGQYGTIRLESLPGDNEAEFVEAERAAWQMEKAYGVPDTVYQPKFYSYVAESGVTFRLVFVSHYRNVRSGQRC